MTRNTYDPLNRLTAEGGRPIQHSGLGIVKRGGTAYARTPDSTVISQRTSAGARRNYLYNGEGSVVGTGGPGGSVAANASYDPYGNILNAAVGDENPFGYLGGYTFGGEGVRKGLCGPPVMFDGASGLYDGRHGRVTGYGVAVASHDLTTSNPWGLLSRWINEKRRPIERNVQELAAPVAKKCAKGAGFGAVASAVAIGVEIRNKVNSYTGALNNRSYGAAFDDWRRQKAKIEVGKEAKALAKGWRNVTLIGAGVSCVAGQF